MIVVSKVKEENIAQFIDSYRWIDGQLKEFGKLLIENKRINEYKPKLKYWESTFLGKLNNGVYAWIIESSNGYTVHPHLFQVKIKQQKE